MYTYIQQSSLSEISLSSKGKAGRFCLQYKLHVMLTVNTRPNTIVPESCFRNLSEVLTAKQRVHRKGDSPKSQSRDDVHTLPPRREMKGTSWKSVYKEGRTCTRTCTRVHILTYLRRCVSVQHVHMGVYAYILLCMHVSMCMHILFYILMYIYTENYHYEKSRKMS